jgi:hypothetical protein
MNTIFLIRITFISGRRFIASTKIPNRGGYFIVNGKIALLIETDDWNKMLVFQNFLAENPKTVWRTKLNYSTEFLESFDYPINLYFFHRNTIKYKANCLGIYRGRRADWPLTLSPPEYRAELIDYTNYFVLDRIVRVGDTHISEFPKWDNPNNYYPRGIQGLLWVADILDLSKT